MTRKELVNFIGYCDHVKTGYCCYQDDGISKFDLKEVGTNNGAYGWNWTCYYYPATDTAYISNYRGVPACIKER